MKFNERLKQKRIESNITQEQLAESLHITRQAVSNWERGISEPDLETLQKISEKLNWPISDMMNQKEEKKKINWKKIILCSLLCLVSSIIHSVLYPTLKDYVSQSYRIQEIWFYTFWIMPLFYFLSGVVFSSFFEHLIDHFPKKTLILCTPVIIYYLCFALYYFPFRTDFYAKLMIWLIENRSTVNGLMIFEGIIFNLTLKMKSRDKKIFS